MMLKLFERSEKTFGENPLALSWGLQHNNKKSGFVFQEGDFLWTDGSEVDFLGWATGRPRSTDTNQDCAEINFRGMNAVSSSLMILTG